MGAGAIGRELSKPKDGSDMTDFEGAKKEIARLRNLLAEEEEKKQQAVGNDVARHIWQAFIGLHHGGKRVADIGSSLLLQRPAKQWLAPLDPLFCPFVLGKRAYLKAVDQVSTKEIFTVGVERHNGLVARYEIPCFRNGHANYNDSFVYAERLIKFVIWQKGGFRLHLHGPREICDYIAEAYCRDGIRAFDQRLMAQAYCNTFQTVIHETVARVPKANNETAKIGGNLDGCRIGFDLGGSDFKLAAVKEGEAIFTTEIPWDPYNEPDPEVHFKKINEGLALVKEKLGGRVDAIGGSSAGVLVDNEFRVASLFRSVSSKKFDTLVRPMMSRIEKKWGVPVMCVNDGEVTALAGAQSLKKNALLGIAMGTSEAAGYIGTSGNVTTWLNELAFCPVDFHPKGGIDEWSGDYGCGVQYFSQQAVNRLAPAAGYAFPDGMKLPERLLEVQKYQKGGEEGAKKIYMSIGTYLGYAVATYADFYPGLENVMILGRVTSGTGCEVILARARAILAAVFPELKVELHVPDEKMKRVGQSVAAASLPLSR